MSSEIYEAIEQLSRSKGIDVEKVIEALEEAIAAAAKRSLRSKEDIVARFDRQTGTMQAFARMTVVETVEEEDAQMDLGTARQMKPDAVVGDAFYFPRPTVNLGRIAAQQAKQVINQRVREAERENVFNEYRGRNTELVNGQVKRFEKGDIIVDLGRTEAVLPKREQSRVERYSVGDRVRAVIVDVLEVSKGPQVVLSRSAPELLVKLFEMEVPEIYDGTVRIMGCVREPGERAKVAVRSENREIDPVGACVGIKGSRVQAIIRELRGEKIDIVPWSQDPMQLLMNALNPARVNKVVILDEAAHAVEVNVDDDQLSLAIGKRGQNVRLASKLTGWRIEVHSERERKEAAEREMKLLLTAPAVLQKIPGIDQDRAQRLIEGGVRTYEEFLDAPPRTIMDLLGLGDDEVDAMIDAADELEAKRIEDEKKAAEEAVRLAAEQAAAAAAAAVVAAAAAAAAAEAAAADAAAAEAAALAPANGGDAEAAAPDVAVATGPADVTVADEAGSAGATPDGATDEARN
jgi:N utilization substance protein A